MRPHHRRPGDGERIDNRSLRAVRQIDKNAEAIAFPDDLLAQFGQARVFGRLRLDIADRVSRVVNQLEMAHAEIVGGFDVTGVGLDEARTLDRQHDVGLPAQGQINVFRRAQDLELLPGEMLLDPPELALEPAQRLAWLRHRLLHIGVMSSAQRDALKAIAGVSNEFKLAVDGLFNKCAQVRDSFFLLHPDLRPLYDAYAQVDMGFVASVSYTHTSATLEPEIMAADHRLLYKHRQQLLLHRGVMIEATRDALRSVRGVSKVFLPAVDELFNQGQSALTEFFSLVATFQDTLAHKRKREQALQRVAAAAEIDLNSARALLDPTIVSGGIYPLHAVADRNQPVLNDVLAVGTQGLSAEFFFRDKATGTVDQRIAAVANLDYSPTNGHPLPQNPTGAAISGIWSGALEVSETSYYNIIIAADVEALITLKFDGRDQPLIQNGTFRQNRDPLELKAGTIHDMVLTVEKVKSLLSVKWESQKQRLQVIPGGQLYPSSVLHPFQDAFVRFLKLMSLGGNLGLTTSEIAYLATDADSLINGEAWLNHIPTKSVRVPNETTALRALLKPFWGLLDFSHIKADWSPDDERVLTVLKDPTAATASTDSLLFKLSSWNKTSFVAVLQHLGIDIKDLGKIRLLRRIYDAFAPIQHLAIPASKLISATTNEPSSSTVRELQAALRARFDVNSWRDVVRPINDTLRGLQRDALVAYVLHQMRENATTAHIDTADKLFEYFLMDVEMDPCMQTSRVRNALSTVQLFIERCLMNLEQPDVLPSSIDAAKWTWMKRYRMWEANRKVFLFPENWLEPELRDDKSPFFKEVETQLLQSDITDDSAASAVLTYLMKLEEVAKLEPCGMYLDEKGRDNEKDDVVHVVARTSGAHRVYYYRRYELGSWTPWEHIKLDIEDNPVVPFVWQNRLLLFWLRIIKKGPEMLRVPDSIQDDKIITELNVSQMMKAVNEGSEQNTRELIGSVLCWSEYYDGKWQPPKTSDVTAPLNLGEFAANTFSRNLLTLHLVRDPEWNFISISPFASGGVDPYFIPFSFFFFNTHSSPLQQYEVHPNAYRIRNFRIREGRLLANYDTFINYRLFDHIGNDLMSINRFSRQIPTFNLVANLSSLIETLPFFYEDHQNVFYVTTKLERARITNQLGYGLSAKQRVANATYIPRPALSSGSKDGNYRGLFDPTAAPADQPPKEQFVIEDAYWRREQGMSPTVEYGEQQIGPSRTPPNAGRRKR